MFLNSFLRTAHRQIGDFGVALISSVGIEFVRRNTVWGKLVRASSRWGSRQSFRQYFWPRPSWHSHRLQESRIDSRARTSERCDDCRSDLRRRDNQLLCASPHESRGTNSRINLAPARWYAVGRRKSRKPHSPELNHFAGRRKGNLPCGFGIVQTVFSGILGRI